MQDKSEFVKVIKENEGVIFKITSVYASNKEDQKDLYQEIVYQLWKAFGSFRAESKISTWMYRIALNTSIAHLNKGKKKEIMVSIDESILNTADQHDTLMEERFSSIKAHINKLNLIDKGIILLYLEGKNYNEIASITGFTNTNVGTRLTRIKQNLKTQINK